MKHAIPIDQFGPTGENMAQAVEKCVHCGFCLPTCPTYQVLGEEMDSPRGRIILMKAVLEGGLELEEAIPYIDRCLGCQACVTACPSGVSYGELLSPFRGYASVKRQRALPDRLIKTLVLETLPYPERFRWAARAGRVSRGVSSFLPEKFKAMISLLPERLPTSTPLPEFYPAEGVRRAQVALLTGCVQQVLAPQINWATIRVLARNGVDVLIPTRQGCCGALPLHVGALDRARQLAALNFDAFPQDVDAIVTNTAGCGSGMHEYPLLFKGTPLEEKAIEFSSRVVDVSVFLTRLGLNPPRSLPTPQTLAYQDACHLIHAQSIALEPLQLLKNLDNLTLVPLPESQMCCGSAGTYNLEQPEIARQLGLRKAQHIRESGAQGVISGNIGCMTQLRASLDMIGAPLPVWHTMEILERAYSVSFRDKE